MIKGRVRFDVQGRFRAVVDGDWKLIWTPGQDARGEHQLYDIATDPKEASDQSGEHPERVRDLRRMLDDWMATGEQRAAGPIPDGDKEALRALGYIDD
jgi:arylsulfatase A-like enzyme